MWLLENEKLSALKTTAITKESIDAAHSWVRVKKQSGSFAGKS
jgi:hypothetical protein